MKITILYDHVNVREIGEIVEFERPRFTSREVKIIEDELRFELSFARKDAEVDEDGWLQVDACVYLCGIDDAVEKYKRGERPAMKFTIIEAIDDPGAILFYDGMVRRIDGLRRKVR